MGCCSHYFSILAKFLSYKQKSEVAVSSCQRQFCLGGNWLVTQMSLESENTWQALSTFSLWMRNWWVNSSVQQRFLMVMPKPFTSSFPVQMELYRNSHTSISTAITSGLAVFKYWKQYKARKQIWENFVKLCVYWGDCSANASHCPSSQGSRLCLVGSSTSVSDCHRKIQVQKHNCESLTCTGFNGGTS